MFLRGDRWLCIPLRAHGGARMTRRSEVCLALSSELDCGQRRQTLDATVMVASLERERASLNLKVGTLTLSHHKFILIVCLGNSKLLAILYKLSDNLNTLILSSLWLQGILSGRAQDKESQPPMVRAVSPSSYISLSVVRVTAKSPLNSFTLI